MSLMQHYDKVISRMQLDICRLVEEKAEIEACVEDLIAIRDQARAVYATACGTYNDKRTSVDRKKLSDLGLMVKESYKTIPSEFNSSEAETDVKTTTEAGRSLARPRETTCYAIFQGDDMNCPKCGSENVSTERRIDGMKTCLDCGYKWRNVAQAGHVVTSCHEDRTYKRCLCCVCGEIHKCTPSFDFYTTDDHGEALVCERCFHEYLGHRLNAEKWVADESL